jgi:hypothetical protein
MGTFVTDPTTDGTDIFPDGDKSAAPGIKVRAGWTTDNYIRAVEANAIRDALLDLRTEVRAREFNVKHYGAVGDGVTNDAAAIQSAIDECVAAGGGIVFFPGGAYLVSDQGALWSGFRYALRIASASSAPIIFRGVGKKSSLKMAAHNDADTTYDCFLDLHLSTGRIVVEDLQIETPAPSTTGQGRVAITVGDMGGAAGSANSGTVESLIVQRCVFTNPSFALHGEGCKHITFRDNDVTIKGGGLYPTYFAEPINIGSRGNAYESTVLIENNKFANDSTNGDHVFYLLGQYKSVTIRKNEWDVVNHDAVKFSSWGLASHETGKIVVEDNDDTRSSYHSGDAGGEACFMVCVADGTNTGSCRELVVRNNRVKYAHQFLNTEWAFDLANVEKNVATYCQDIAVHMLKLGALALRGHCNLTGNNFDGVNVSDANNISVKVEAFLSATVMGNRAKTTATNGRFIDAATATMEWLVSVGNYASKTAYWYEQSRWANVHDFGNSWDRSVRSKLAQYTGGDTTPSVAGCTAIVLTNSGATTITQFDDAEIGQELTVTFMDGNSTISNANVYTAGGASFTGTIRDVIKLLYIGGGLWHEVCRSIN